MDNKKAQSEMVGFGIIVIIVAVIILVVISLLIHKPTNNYVQSYETESFLQGVMQYTTNCTENTHHLSYLDLADFCGNKGICDSGRSSCAVLNETSIGLTSSAWKYGPQNPVKGYEYTVIWGNKTLINFQKGNQTSQKKGSEQNVGRVLIKFIAYY